VEREDGEVATEDATSLCCPPSSSVSLRATAPCREKGAGEREARHARDTQETRKRHARDTQETRKRHAHVKHHISSRTSSGEKLNKNKIRTGTAGEANAADEAEEADEGLSPGRSGTPPKVRANLGFGFSKLGT
jgi:hypothetical protein